MSVELLEFAASSLGPLVEEVVFVGGATIHLWITDPAAPPIRATDDVDVICDIASLPQYYRFGKQLRKRGFDEAVGEQVICRWRHRETGLLLDVMPTDESVLGFSNPWYSLGIKTARLRHLPSGAHIYAAAPPAILATKLAAWKSRGKNDLFTSLDIYDIIILLDGRQELLHELTKESSALQEYIQHELDILQTNPYFSYAIESALQGYHQLASDRATTITKRIQQITRRKQS